MDSCTFNGLQDHFMSKLSDLQMMMEVRDAIQEDRECLDHLQGLQSEVEHFQSATALMRGELQRQKDKLKKLQDTNLQFDKLIEHLNFTLSNIPERLPKPQQESGITSSEMESGDKKQSNHKPAKVSSANQKSTTETAPPTTTVSQPVTAKQPNTYYPEIEYLKVDEFSEVPKYLKGRITYDQVNKFIDGMNKAYISKYKLLKQKKSSLNDLNRKRYEKYKGQENKDTAGCYFITDDDLKDYGGLKIDNVGRSIQTILRHCKRVREVRGGKLTRIVYIDSY